MAADDFDDDDNGLEGELPEGDDDFEQDPEWEAWCEHKSALMAKSLGPEHDMVMHAIIPYALGGSLDLYYFPSGLPGTAIATKELAERPNEGPSSDYFQSYELVMFTRQPIDLDAALDEGTPFGREHRTINAILNCMANYSGQATLNPYETCEFPEEMEVLGGKCLVFDAYACHTDDVVQDFGLLLLIEVFRSEMDYAREQGGEALLELLKAHGHYPYSDLNREPVA